MKIFVTSDIHGNSIILNKLKDFANNNDINKIIICGDITGKHYSYTLQELSEKQYQDYAKFLLCLNEINKECLFILGNDDWIEAVKSDCFYLPNLEIITYSSITKGKYQYNKHYNFIPFEYVHITPFNTNREVNENKMEYELNKLKYKYCLNDFSNSIIVAHDVPHKCLDRCLDGREVGSKSIRNFIIKNKPLVWLGGHIHESYNYKKLDKTHVFNCACDHTRDLLRGWIIDLNTMKCESIII